MLEQAEQSHHATYVTDTFVALVKKPSIQCDVHQLTGGRLLSFGEPACILEALLGLWPRSHNDLNSSHAHLLCFLLYGCQLLKGLKQRLHRVPSISRTMSFDANGVDAC